MRRLAAGGSRLGRLRLGGWRLGGWRLGSLAVTGLALGAAACGGTRIDPAFSPEPRLEATIEALGDELTRLRLAHDTLSATTDSLRVELARLQLELHRIKEIDLRRRTGRGRP
jgi:hypothetical protein